MPDIDLTATETGAAVDTGVVNATVSTLTYSEGAVISDTAIITKSGTTNIERPLYLLPASPARTLVVTDYLDFIPPADIRETGEEVDI